MILEYEFAPIGLYKSNVLSLGIQVSCWVRVCIAKRMDSRANGSKLANNWISVELNSICYKSIQLASGSMC